MSSAASGRQISPILLARAASATEQAVKQSIDACFHALVELFKPILCNCVPATAWTGLTGITRIGGRPLLFDGDCLSPWGILVLLRAFYAAVPALDHRPMPDE